MSTFESLLRSTASRLVHLLLVLLAVSVLTFVMLDQLPGDAALVLGSMDSTASEIEELRHQMGLDEGVAQRYFTWLAKVVTGDWGESFATGETTLGAIGLRFPVTLELMVLSLFLALLMAVFAAIVSARNPGGRADRMLGTIAFGSLAIPAFVMAILLVGIFSIWLGWFPTLGFVSVQEGLLANLHSMALPVLSIAMIEWVPLYRVLRGDLIATLDEEFILLARAKGLSDAEVLIKHALRPSMITLITVLGLQVGHLIGGALVIEIVFALPGMGETLIMAIYNRDLFIVQGCILVITLGYVFTNIAVDWLLVWLDPRIRTGGRL